MQDSLRPPRIADAIADRLEGMILEGVLRPGERLLGERELAEKLGVSRPSLREALDMLAARGLLTTEKSGTRIAQFLSPLLKPLAAMMQDKPSVTADYFEFRRFQEVHAARLAAERATEVDREAIRRCTERMTKAHTAKDLAQEDEADVELHLLIYEASHNVVLLHVMRALADLLRNNIFYSRSKLYQQAGVRDELLTQHLAIANAIIGGKVKEAEDAAAGHIRFTLEAVEEIRRDELRLVTSLNRVKRANLLAD